MCAPDVALDVYATAHGTYGTGGVECLGHIIEVANEAGILHAVGPPLFVHGSPGYNGGVVAVADNLLAPLAQEVAGHFGVVGVHTP